jgi:hypothetical protein
MNLGLENEAGMVILTANTGSVPSAAAKSAPAINYPGYYDGWARGNYEIRERRENGSPATV